MIIKRLGRNDVIFGRGTGPNEHKGNVAFRLDVLRVLKDSSAKWKIDKTCTKANMSSKVIQRVHDRGGRFVRQLTKEEVMIHLAIRSNEDQAPSSPATVFSNKRATETPEVHRDDHLYVEVPDSIALEKTKQSFRHQKRILSSQLRRTKTALSAKIGSIDLSDLASAREEIQKTPSVDDVKVDSSPRSAFSSIDRSHWESQKATAKNHIPGRNNIISPTDTSFEVGSAVHLAPPLSMSSPVFRQRRDFSARQLLSLTPQTSRIAADHTKTGSLVSTLITTLENEQKMYHDASMALLAARQSLLFPSVASTPLLPVQTSSPITFALAAQDLLSSSDVDQLVAYLSAPMEVPSFTTSKDQSGLQLLALRQNLNNFARYY